MRSSWQKVVPIETMCVGSLYEMPCRLSEVRKADLLSGAALATAGAEQSSTDKTMSDVGNSFFRVIVEVIAAAMPAAVYQ